MVSWLSNREGEEAWGEREGERQTDGSTETERGREIGVGGRVRQIDIERGCGKRERERERERESWAAVSGVNSRELRDSSDGLINY